MKPEVLALLDQARSSYRAAVLLSQQGYPDFSASRAYYAMFYAATAALAHFNIARSKHSGIVAAFGEYLVKSGEIESEFGRMLPGAFDARQEADYSALVALDRPVAEFRLE